LILPLKAIAIKKLKFLKLIYSSSFIKKFCIEKINKIILLMKIVLIILFSSLEDISSSSSSFNLYLFGSIFIKIKKIKAAKI